MTSSALNLPDYQVIETLSVRPQREVLKALTPEEDTVILKRLRLGLVKDWKALELFEREASVLQELRHARIPRLLDFYYQTHDDETVLTQVLEWIPGLSLAQRLAQGWRPQEAEVLAIARQALMILTELHGREPQVIHRDLKPSNLIWTEQQELFLIDFGAVRELMLSKGSSTVIGTFGYMAPEQFIGQSAPASDLYGLGATLLHLLAGKPPSEIPLRQLRLDFREHVDCSAELQRWLEQLLEPELEERFADARSALTALENLTRVSEVSPSGRLVLTREDGTIQICLRPYDRLSFWWQQSGWLALAGGMLANLFWLCDFLSRPRLPDGEVLIMQSHWLAVLVIAALTGLACLLAIERRLVLIASEKLTLRLSPQALSLERLHPQPVRLIFPREAIVKFQSWYFMGGLGMTRSAPILLYKPKPDSYSRELVIAGSLSKRDHYWLMTRLLLYHHQTRTQNSG